MAMSVTVPRYTVDDLERFPDDGDRYTGIVVTIDLAEVFAGLE